MVVCVFAISRTPIEVSVVLIYFSHIFKTYRCISSAGVCIPASTCLCVCYRVAREVGGWGRDPKKCTGRDWGMGSSTI